MEPREELCLTSFEHLIALSLLLLNVAVLVLVIMYAAQILAALRPEPNTRPAGPDASRRVAVLVPAHDEEDGIGATLAALRRAMTEGDKLLVIADNCSDATASIARAAGAEVVERHDLLHRGKGFALDAGLRHLAQSPPDIVIVIDADCLPQPDALRLLAETSWSSGRPVQSLYLMQAPAGAPLGTKISEFAFMLKNRVRQRGLQRLGLPCYLTGSGMAFPWQAIKELDLADKHLAEDMKMGLQLSLAGNPPQFCEQAVVLSVFPETTAGLKTQRGRWMKGHISLIATALRALPTAVLRGDVTAALATVATAIPPLTLFVLLLGLLLALSLVVSVFVEAGSAAVLLSLFNLTLALAVTFVAWLKFGQELLPPRSAARAVWLILARLIAAPIYFIGLRSTSWMRTDRSRSGK